MKFYVSHREMNEEKLRNVALMKCMHLPRSSEWCTRWCWFWYCSWCEKMKSQKENMHKDSRKKISHTMKFSQCFRLHARWSDFRKKASRNEKPTWTFEMKPFRNKTPLTFFASFIEFSKALKGSTQLCMKEDCAKKDRLIISMKRN